MRRDLITTVDIIDNRAPAPPLEAVKALEQATVNGKTAADRFAAAIYRHILGASGRHNDYLHIKPTTMYTDENTTEFVAWQTKSTDLLNNRRPMPFIAPHHSFTGIPWWRTLVEGVKAIIALNDDRDFLIAPPTMDHTGIRAIPITSSQSLLWYRAILVMGGLEQAVAIKQTLSGLSLIHI